MNYFFKNSIQYFSFCFTCVLLLICNLSYGQLDSIQKIDSALVAQKALTLDLITETKEKNLHDSIQELLLKTQKNTLKTTDKKKKERIQKRIDSLQKAQSQRDLFLQKEIDSLRANTVGVPVVLAKDTLFYVYSKQGVLSPTERAERISKKIESIVTSGSFDVAAFSIDEIDLSYEILYEESVLISVSDRDAFWVAKTPDIYANEILERVKDCSVRYAEKNSLQSNAIRIGLMILVLVVFYIVVKYINKGIKYANQKLITKYKHLLKGITIKNYEFLSQEKELKIIRLLFKSLRFLLIITVVYITLPTILSIFPATEGIAAKLIGFVLTPLKNVIYGFINFIPSLFAIAIILFVTRSFIRFLKFLADEISSEKLKIRGFYPDWAKPTFNLLKIVIYAFSFVVIFPYLPGSDSPVFKGVSVFFGLLISLGSSSAIGNIIAGLVITYMRAFKIGDRVKISGTVGDVIEKTMLVTRVRTPKNEEVSIPNAAILNGSTINYSSTSEDLGLGLVLHTTITLGYDVPWPKVHEVLIAAAVKTSLVDDNPKPFVLQTSLDDFYVSYQLNAYTKHPKSSPKIYSELHANIQDACNEAGIEILSPHYRAGRDGNATTIPAHYLDEKYRAPSFNVNINKNSEEGQ
ncbi:mechanosensitive ion channel family protein [Flavicella marina]|uniref:mechanosensitive ion channel family protein n=1 Tax=Flavicella marina TaxID=1475951 RepID=UPI0012655048|nr:mechanosensitive ion channel family protein [Flavicella marina]